MEKSIFIILLIIITVCVLIIFKVYKSFLAQKSRADEYEFKQSDKRFEALVENGMDCVIIISPEGITKYVSRSIKNILGYTPEEVMHMDIMSVTHPDDIDGIKEALTRSIENPGIPLKGHTARIKHKNGSWRWLEPVITNLIHEPSINGIVDNFRDITDRVHAEGELKKSNERLLLATNGSKLGIWDQNLLRGETIWDDTMFTIYGVSKLSFNPNNTTWLALIHEEDRPLLLKRVEKVLSEGIDLDIEFRIILPDLSIRYIRSMAQIHYDEGKPSRLIGINLDITHNKEYELTLEQILFDISHIIRKPVSNILGLSDMIETDIITDPTLKQLATHMKDSAKELDNYTTKLTDNYLKKRISINKNSEKVEHIK